MHPHLCVGHLELRQAIDGHPQGSLCERTCVPTFRSRIVPDRFGRRKDRSARNYTRIWDFLDVFGRLRTQHWRREWDSNSVGKCLFACVFRDKPTLPYPLCVIRPPRILLDCFGLARANQFDLIAYGDALDEHTDGPKQRAAGRDNASGRYSSTWRSRAPSVQRQTAVAKLASRPVGRTKPRRLTTAR